MVPPNRKIRRCPRPAAEQACRIRNLQESRIQARASSSASGVSRTDSDWTDADVACMSWSFGYRSSTQMSQSVVQCGGAVRQTHEMPACGRQLRRLLFTSPEAAAAAAVVRTKTGSGFGHRRRLLAWTLELRNERNKPRYLRLRLRSMCWHEAEFGSRLRITEIPLRKSAPYNVIRFLLREVVRTPRGCLTGTQASTEYLVLGGCMGSIIKTSNSSTKLSHKTGRFKRPKSAR